MSYNLNLELLATNTSNIITYNITTIPLICPYLTCIKFLHLKGKLICLT